MLLLESVVLHGDYMVWIMENDPRAIIAVSSLDDDRLAQNPLGVYRFRYLGRQAFCCSCATSLSVSQDAPAYAFSTWSGIDSVRAQRVAMSAARDKRPAMRETAIYILGLLESPVATPILIQALNDQVPAVRMQAVKALGV